MTPHQSNIIHTMIATLMGHVHHSEASKPNKLLSLKLKIKNKLLLDNIEYEEVA